MIYTKNFHPDIDTKLRCTCGHKACDQRSVAQWVLNQLQKIRDDLGEGIIVTSGGRCQYHPNEVRKTMPGDHQKCTATDILYKNKIQMIKLITLAGRHGATRMGLAGEFIHLAWTPTGDKSVPAWTY